MCAISFAACTRLPDFSVSEERNSKGYREITFGQKANAKSEATHQKANISYSVENCDTIREALRSELDLASIKEDADSFIPYLSLRQAASNVRSTSAQRDCAPLNGWSEQTEAFLNEIDNFFVLINIQLNNSIPNTLKETR